MRHAEAPERPRRFVVRGQATYVAPSTRPVYGSPAWELSALEELGYGAAACAAREAGASRAPQPVPDGDALARLLAVLVAETGAAAPEEALHAALMAVKAGKNSDAR